MDQASGRQAGVVLRDRVVLAAEHRDSPQLVDAEQPRAQSIVDVVVVVGDLVRQVRELRLEPRLAPLEKPQTQLAERARIGRRAVLQDPLAGLERQVEARELRIALLELVHHAQRLQVVLEPAELAHAFVERVLPRVTERRMTEVMREADRLGQRLVEPQRTRDAPPDLRDLERMRQARAVQVPFVVDEDLGLVDQAAEGRRMHDAVAIALVLAAMPWRRFREAPAARTLLVLRIRREPDGLGAHRAPRLEMLAQGVGECIRAIIRGDDGFAQPPEQHQPVAALEHFLVHAHQLERALGADARRRVGQFRAAQQVA